MDDCVFCKIVKGEIPTKFVYQNEDLVAFRDIKPIAPVHILVVPKKHIEGIQTVEEKDKELLGKLLLAAKEIAERKGLRGYKLLFNCGSLGGQVVFHLHLHLLGGWKSKEELHRLIKERIEGGGAI